MRKLGVLSKKDRREQQVLLSLIELYLKTGKPIGSQTLKEMECDGFSSATIRNYFAHLEKEGYLEQQHTSGGRVPTDKGLEFYASVHRHSGVVEKGEEHRLAVLRNKEVREVSLFLQQALELLSGLVGYPAFLSAPRFEHDFIRDCKWILLDSHRLVCILLTDFGLLQMETVITEESLDLRLLQRIEAYFQARLQGKELAEELTREELDLAKKLYNEVMLRYLVRYTHFTERETLRTGFARLLNYPELTDPVALSKALALFEHPQALGQLMQEAIEEQGVSFWIGQRLQSYIPEMDRCAVVAIPYAIRETPVGVIGLMGPTRLPYRRLFGLLHLFADYVGESLTKSLSKFKLEFREPREERVQMVHHVPKRLK